MKELIKNDKLYAYYKFPKRNNYKDNLLNSLGVFEHPHTFSFFHSLFLSIGRMRDLKVLKKVA